MVLPVTITNCSNNFGPYQDPEKFISRMITDLIVGTNIKIYGDGKYVRDWLYVADHVWQLMRLSIKGNYSEKHILVGGLTQGINNLEIAEKVIKIFGRGDIKFVKDRPGHDRRYSVDWSKLIKGIGLDAGKRILIHG